MDQETHVFRASRWTSGNLFFPVRIEITQDRVSRIKPHLIGSDEESMAIQRVASVRIHTGLIWSDIRIESSGGTDPIECHGHGKKAARQIQDIIQRLQSGRGTGHAPET
ncbi:MAG: hypothetical protein ACYCPQ_07690 [Elusimicrobiota bacterium]